MNEISNNEIEVLVTTMNLENPENLIKKMNITTAVAIGNQCDKNEINKIKHNDGSILVYSFNERGVGLNRNNLLMRTKSKICLFGDDDLVYKDDYANLIIKYFNKYKDADIIIFNLEEKNSKRYKIKEDFKVNYLNFMRFGAARLVVKTKSIQRNGIYFNVCFGGGTEYSNGEDTLFLASCLKQKLKIYAVNATIATLDNSRESTWFNGYNEKYFKDKGVLYYIISKKYYKLLCLQDVIRHKKLYEFGSVNELYHLMISGIHILKEGK